MGRQKGAYCMNARFKNHLLPLVVLILLSPSVSDLRAGLGEKGAEPDFASRDRSASLTAKTAGHTEGSPAALVASPDGKRLFIALCEVNQVGIFDIAAGSITGRIDVPSSPSGLALTRDGSKLFVTCAAPASTVCVIDVAQGRIIDRLGAGHTAQSPVLSPDEKTLYVCNRFNNDLSVIDVETGDERHRIRVEREPVAAAITPDGKLLVVANHLSVNQAADPHRGAVVSVIDTATRAVVGKIPLTLGASLLRGVAISPDGRLAAVTHLRAMFWLSTSATDMGRINGNALTVVDLRRLQPVGTLLLDQVNRGAANPWAVVWTSDAKTIVVSHAGTHELSLIDAPVDADSWNFPSLTLSSYAEFGGRVPGPPCHPVRVRARVPLTGIGPRALAIAGSHVYVANYYSRDLCRIDPAERAPVAEKVDLGFAADASVIRRGEILFNDARLCSQGWQSCASCHDDDARTDGLNWDLLNDGAGNPKNTKSLVGAHQTAPAMALGIRADAETAVRAGIHHILFTDQRAEVGEAIDAYLRSLSTLPSPHLREGQLSAAAKRGEALFESARTGCAECHPPPLFTDLAAYDVGTSSAYKGIWGKRGADPSGVKFDTPSLAELWRNEPYLHDGSANNLVEVLTAGNRKDLHGRTSKLSAEELNDLVEFLLSL